MATPYITPAVLTAAPSGVSWSIIPDPDSDLSAQLAAQTLVCWKATSRLDTYCNQILRATVNTEYPLGPGGPRCTVDRNTGNGTLIMKRWPVTEVLAIQTSPARSFNPQVWSPVPAGNWRIRHPLIWSGETAFATAPDGGWTIDVAPGWISWKYGRGGLLAQVCHVNGWPHTSLTANAQAGAEALQVDDVTGWTLAAGFAYDGAATESVAVGSVSANTPLVLPNGAGTAQAGPGTMALTGPLEYAHPAGTMISAFPATLIEAAIYAACYQAIDAGIDAIAVQSLGGDRVSSGEAAKDIATEMEILLDKFIRVF